MVKEKLFKCELHRKMRTKLFIAGLLMMVFGNVHAQSAQHNPYDKPEHDLSKNKLSSTDVRAYQKRAIQKVEEFYQYLEAMADTKHKNEVRDKALDMAKRQFGESAQIKIGNEEEPINNYLERCRDGNTYKSIDTMKVIQPLVLTPNGFYEGKIEVRYKEQNSKMRPNKNLKIQMEVVSVILKRRKKKFGNTSRIIWELYLNEVEEL